VIFGGLIVIALFGALLAPFFIDWTAYRTAFEREATRVVGQPVEVRGTAKVRILPLPTLTFTDLSIGINPDGSPMMTVQAFSLNAELMPLLSGEVKIVDMTLTRPDANVTVSEGGAISWTARKAMLVDPGRVQVEKLNIVDGSFRIEGLAGGRTIRGEGVMAEMTAQTLVGPWRIAATGLIDGVMSAFEITTGRAQQDGAIRVKAAARREGLPYRLGLDGTFGLKDEVLHWDGGFDIAAASEPAVPGEAQPAAALPVTATGLFAATPDVVDIPEYRLEVGPREDPYTVTGAAQVSIREEISFEATAEGRQIDLDRIGRDESQARTAGPTSLEERFAVLRGIVDRIPVPQVEGKIDVLLPAVVAGDTMIREVRATVRPDRDGWRIDSLDLALPGNTLVEARGRLGTGGDFGFTGHMLLASRQPTGFAAWLSGRSNAALRRLSNAGFEADVTLSGRQASFDNLELVLDDAVLRGKLQRLGAADGRPGIVAELSGERIDTDDLVAVYALTQRKGAAELTDHDLDITLQAGLIEGFGLTAREFDAHVRIEAGSVTVDRLSAADFHGARIEGSGRLTDLVGQPGGRFSLAVEAQDGSPLAALALDRLGENRFLRALASDPELTQNLSFKAEVEARPQADGSRGTLTVSGWASGTAFALRDNFEGRPSEWRAATHDITADFRQQSPALLARQFSLPVTPIDAPGPVAFKADIAGSPLFGMNVDLSVNAQDTALSLKGRVAIPEPGPAPVPPDFSLDVTFGTQDIDPWLILAGYPLPGTGEGHPASLRFAAAAREGVYSIAGLSGMHGGNPVTGEISLDMARPGRPKATGDLSFGMFSLPFAGELLFGASVIAGDGLTDAIPDIEFGQPFAPGLDAEVRLAAERFDLGGGPEGEAFSATLSLVDGTASLQPLSARWLGGTLDGNLTVRNAGGNAIVNTQLTLADADAGALAQLSGLPQIVSGRIGLGATLEAGGRSLRALVSSLSGSGVATLEGGRIEGISTGGLPVILSRADAEGFEIGSDQVAPVAEAAMLTGSMSVPSATAAFTVVQGRVGLRNLHFADSGGLLDTEGAFDPASGALTASATLKLDAGVDAMAGAEPAATFSWIGTPEALALTTDTRALEGYLSLRAFELEQRRVEILQESVLEKQRLRRETVLTNARIAWRERRRQEELQRLEELQQRIEEEKRELEDRKAGEAPVDTPQPAAAETADPPLRERVIDVVPDPAPRGERRIPNLFEEIQRRLSGD